MTSHYERRTPQRNGGFSWGRIPSEETVEYRLFRRDHTGAVHISRITFSKSVPSEQIAQDLRRKRRELRDRVDVIDLAAMGVEAA